MFLEQDPWLVANKYKFLWQIVSYYNFLWLVKLSSNLQKLLIINFKYIFPWHQYSIHIAISLAFPISVFTFKLKVEWKFFYRGEIIISIVLSFFLFFCENICYFISININVLFYTNKWNIFFWILWEFEYSYLKIIWWVRVFQYLKLSVTEPFL